MSNIKLAVDRDAEVAYITLSSEPIVRSVEHDDCVIVDLDNMNVAVGVELLDLDAKIPFEELTTSYHVKSDVIDILRLIQPTINKFVVNYSSAQDSAVAPEVEASKRAQGSMQDA